MRSNSICAILAVALGIVGCLPTSTPSDLVTLTGTASAGPTCPVEQDPPDPDCAARPVAGAEIVVLDLDGSEIARMTTDADGAFSVDLVAGTYRLVPQPVEGLMLAPDPVEVDLEAGEASNPVDLAYDTGIR